MRRYRDIRARAEAGSIGRKSRRRERSTEDDDNLTFDLCRFGVHEPNSVEIRLAVLEILSYRYTDKHTCRHLSSLYVLASRPSVARVTLDKVELGLRIFLHILCIKNNTYSPYVCMIKRRDYRIFLYTIFLVLPSVPNARARYIELSMRIARICQIQSNFFGRLTLSFDN